jgi:hypothetical protein
VSDENRCRPGFSQDILHVGTHSGTEPGIEGVKGLVEQNNARVYCESSGESDTLLLTAGHLMGIALLEPLEPNHFEEVSHPTITALGLVEPECDVLLGGKVREESALLWDVTDVALLRRQIAPAVVCNERAERYPPCVKPFEASDQTQKRRLPASRRPEDRDEGPIFDLEFNAC